MSNDNHGGVPHSGTYTPGPPGCSQGLVPAVVDSQARVGLAKVVRVDGRRRLEPMTDRPTAARRRVGGCCSVLEPPMEEVLDEWSRGCSWSARFW
jgi:hypothetical protein